MKILFVISDLGLGGAQRVIATLSNHWAKNKLNQISIATFGNTPSAYQLFNVNRLVINISESNNLGFAKNLIRVNKLRKTCLTLKPDIVISFITENNILSILATSMLKVPVVISERSNPFVEKLSTPWRVLRKLCYRYADLLVLQTKGVERFYNDYNVKKLSIKNPLNFKSKIENRIQEKIIITTGRLTPSKNFDLLIEAFAKLSNTAGWQLWILGEGPDRARLEELITKLSVINSVKLLGQVKNVYDYLLKSEIFVLLSEFEGYPNSLIEAMASGLPVISSNCDFGPEEIIKHNQNGILIDLKKKEKIPLVLKHLIENPLERKRLGEKAKEITKELNIESIASKWEEAIENLIT